MLTATFVFKLNNTDGDFKELDDEIMRRAEANAGFKGKEKWLSPDGSQIRVIYYFDSKESLAEFSRDDVHKQAKARYAEWYDGYRVEIAEISGTWGDGNLPSPIKN
jgi:heme oxygenase (staphylobilin-producing)